MRSVSRTSRNEKIPGQTLHARNAASGSEHRIGARSTQNPARSTTRSKSSVPQRTSATRTASQRAPAGRRSDRAVTHPNAQLLATSTSRERAPNRDGSSRLSLSHAPPFASTSDNSMSPGFTPQHSTPLTQPPNSSMSPNVALRYGQDHRAPNPHDRSKHAPPHSSPSFHTPLVTPSRPSFTPTQRKHHHDPNVNAMHNHASVQPSSSNPSIMQPSRHLFPMVAESNDNGKPPSRLAPPPALVIAQQRFMELTASCAHDVGLPGTATSSQATIMARQLSQLRSSSDRFCNRLAASAALTGRSTQADSNTMSGAVPIAANQPTSIICNVLSPVAAYSTHSGQVVWMLCTENRSWYSVVLF